MYAFGTLNRKLINEIINNMCSTYLNDCLKLIQLKFSDEPMLKNMLQIVINGFRIFKTEHATFEFKKKNKLFASSENYNCKIIFEVWKI